VKKSPLILLGLALAGFIYGLVHLFSLRFEAGDNYPPYSSLRADPLGTKALFDSLDPLVPARRNLLPLSKLGEGRDTTQLSGLHFDRTAGGHRDHCHSRVHAPPGLGQVQSQGS